MAASGWPSLPLSLPAVPLVSAQTPALACPPVEVASVAAPASIPVAALPECVISPDDVLAINVFDAPNVTGEYRVSPTGEIVVPCFPRPW